MPDPHADYVAAASQRYGRAHRALGDFLATVFPKVETVLAWDMPMWRIPRPDGAPMPEREGTIDASYVHVGLVERAAGLTLHLWYPPEYDLLEQRADELKEHGLKVMKGCVQFNRQGEFPVEAIESLVAHIVEADGF